MKTHSLARYLIESANARPHAVALVDELQEVPYAELLSRAASLANRLIASGVRKGDPVAILVDRSCDTVIAMHAVILCGGVYAPLDTKAPKQRIEGMLARLEPVLILHDGKAASLLESVEVPNLDVTSRDIDDADRSWSPRIDSRLAAITASDACYIIFTSGTTGEPKGVTISHGNVANYIGWAKAFTEIRDTDRLAGQAPFHFDNSVFDIYLCAAAGATLDIFPSHVFAFPRRLAELVSERRITILFWVPSALTSIAATDMLEHNPPAALRHVLFAGEVMPPTTLLRWMSVLPSARFSNLYGPTEITVDCTWYEVPRDYAGTRVPIGYPCWNTEILIVDESGALCPPGTEGEILVRGSGVGLGYWNRPDLTQAAFVQNPDNHRYVDRTYRTGDRGRIDGEGCLHFLGRLDNQIKRRGYRIELGDVEHALDSLGDLGQSAIAFDQDRDRLVAFVSTDRALTISGLRTRLKELLPAYMLPDELVTLDTMPLNSSGKIDRGALSRRLITKS